MRSSMSVFGDEEAQGLSAEAYPTQSSESNNRDWVRKQGIQSGLLV